MSEFELNKGDDIIFSLDVSGSMQTKDTPSGKSRLEYSLETFKVLVEEAAQIDTDGVSLHTFSDEVTLYPDVTPEKIDQVIAAVKIGGSTETQKAIEEGYKEHVARGNGQTFHIVVTDGQANDTDAVVKTIVDITSKVKDALEYRIIFLQIGKDESAAKFLQYLDDNLSGAGAKYDIVDFKRFEEMDFKALINATFDDAQAAA